MILKHPSNPDKPPENGAARSVSRVIADRMAGVPKSPGVYLMKNADGRVIYVGKAANLKSRLSSYFSRTTNMDAKTGVLVKQVADFETVLTATENEALILESNLIKRHKPRYNVILKDDKRYPSLRMDLRKKYPNLAVVRKIRKDGALYFGPYASALSVRETLKLINRNFKLRKCRDAEPRPRRRPCLNYQINACLAPCCHNVDEQRYGEIVNEVKLFLSGRAGDLVRKVKNDMILAAERQDYETAALLRDKMNAIKQTMEKQVAVTTDFVDRDAVSVARSDDCAVIMLLTVRNGHLQGMTDYTIRDPLSGDAELISAFLSQYYDTAGGIPSEILVDTTLEDAAMYTTWLSEKKGRKVEILCPVRGDRVRLLQMAGQNAVDRLKMITDDDQTNTRLLTGLRKTLGMVGYPRRIECIDNSGTQGKDMVSGIVVFEDAVPKKSDYRKYRLKNVTLQDDYAAMAEVLERRFFGDSMGNVLPDLLMVDGGKGQLNIAVSVLTKLGLESRVPVIAIAKKDVHKKEPDDKIFLAGRVNPVNFSTHSKQLFLLKRIRDEAHRYAITFHRSKRNTRAMQSALDGVPGIGEKRKKVLLKHFESIEGIGRAGIEEIAGLPGMNRKAAENLVAAFQESGQ